MNQKLKTKSDNGSTGTSSFLIPHSSLSLDELIALNDEIAALVRAGVPLEAGFHRIKVAYTDYRWKKFRNEYWMTWQEEEMWQGTPVLEVSGPGLDKQPLPRKWLYRD